MKKILHYFTARHPLYILFYSIVAAEILTLIVVSVMSIVYHGAVTSEYLVTGAFAALVAAAAVVSVIVYLITEMKGTQALLSEREQLLTHITENVGDIIWSLDLATMRFVYVSPSVEILTGFTVDEFANQPIEEMLTPESYKMAMGALAEELSHEGSDGSGSSRIREIEWEYYHKDGHPMVFAATMTFLRDSTGTATGIIGVSRDVTEQKTVEATLRESEEKFRVLSTSAHDAIIMMNSEGRVKYWNPAAEKMFGYAADEILNRNLHGLLAPRKYMKAYEEGFSGFRTSGQGAVVGKTGEYEGTKKDGTIFPIELSVSSIFLQGEWWSVGVIRDITDRKLVEEKLREYSQNLELMVEGRTRELKKSLNETEKAREKLDAILTSIADGLIVTDTYNRVVLMNRAAEDILKTRFSEAVNRPIDRAVSDKTLLDRLKNILSRKDGERQFDFSVRRKDREHPRVIRARTSMVFDKDGAYAGSVTIMNDVTYEREVDRMKTAFVTTAAHELRTPLTSIRGFAELLVSREDISAEERRRFLSHIHNQSVRLAALIDDLLEISRIESGEGYRLDRKMVDMNDIIRETVAPYQELCHRRIITVRLPEGRGNVMADPEKIGQVLRNILSNAVKFSPAESPIDVKGAVINRHYRVSVSDHGIGMTPEQTDKIFDKFYRADMSDNAPVGTGLGMTIVKYIIEAHGGTVRVDSDLGKGTAVTFTVPL